MLSPDEGSTPSVSTQLKSESRISWVRFFGFWQIFPIMEQRFHKYFWDTGVSTGNDPSILPPIYRFRRILEYASFPDMIHYPFAEVQELLPTMPLDRLRISQDRRALLSAILPYLAQSTNWEEAIMTMVCHNLKRLHHQAA